MEDEENYLPEWKMLFIVVLDRIATGTNKPQTPLIHIAEKTRWSGAELYSAHTVVDLYKLRTRQDRTGYTQNTGQHTRHDREGNYTNNIKREGLFTISPRARWRYNILNETQSFLEHY